MTDGPSPRPAPSREAAADRPRAHPLHDEFVRQSIDAVIVTSPASVVEVWSPAAERIYGIAAGDAVGRAITTLIETFELDGSPLDRETAIAAVRRDGSWRRRVIQRPGVGSTSGQDVVVDAGVALLRGPDGEPVGLLSVNRDLTATSRLETEMAALGSIVLATGEPGGRAKVADVALDILCRATGAEAGLVTSSDPEYTAVGARGIRPETIDVIVSFGQLGGPLAIALEAPDAWVSADVATAPIREDVRAAVLADGIRHLIVVGLRLEGRLVGILALGWRHERPREPSRSIMLQAAAVVASSLENARLLRAAEGALDHYRALFEGSPDAVLVLDGGGRVVDANSAAIRLYGPGLVGRRQAGLVDGTSGRRVDGSTFPQEVDVRTIEVAGERRTLAIVRDVTDRRRLQTELVQAQKMEAIGLLVAGVAHELNNPLASIIAFSQLIRIDPALPDDLRTQADLLVQEANRTRSIVTNLLDFARQRPPERVRTSLRPLVENSLELQAYVLRRANVTVDVAIPPGLPAVEVDRAQFQQVLLNLTLNAVQAIASTGRPGRVRVSAAPMTDTPASGLRIDVTDDGPGVPPEIRERLFVPFVTTKPPGEGTGLGLSVSFGIVAGHGGTIRHEPNADGGATFVIELPVDGSEPPDPAALATPPESAAARAPAAVDARSTPSASTSDGAGAVRATDAPDAAEARPGSPRILVLDDEPSIREFLRRVLLRSGYEPVVAASGPDALAIIRADPPDAILCDHRMAGMTGTEFHAAVAAIAPRLARRFAFMSGDVLNPELHGFATTPGVQLLAKPFDIGAVDALVQTLLGGPAA